MNPISISSIANRVLLFISVGKNDVYAITFSSPLIIKIFVAFFQGQIMFKDPKIKPVNKASVVFLCFFRTQDSI